MLFRPLGWQRRNSDDHTLSNADALAKTASESMGAIVQKQRILFAGFVERTEEERLPQRVMFVELVGGKGYSGGQETDWMAHLKEQMSVIGMKFQRWRKVAQKAGRWFRLVWWREPSCSCGNGMERRDVTVTLLRLIGVALLGMR